MQGQAPLPFQASPFLPQPGGELPSSCSGGSQPLPPPPPVGPQPPVPTPQQATQQAQTHGPRHPSIVLVHVGLKARVPTTRSVAVMAACLAECLFCVVGWGNNVAASAGTRVRVQSGHSARASAPGVLLFGLTSLV